MKATLTFKKSRFFIFYHSLQESQELGGTISNPYLGAVARIFSRSAGLTAGGEAERSATGTPISAQNFSNPAGVTQHNSLAGVAPILVKR
jgi:hypothetical protein